eukprot:2424683-Amphidinium_carterae.1
MTMLDLTTGDLKCMGDRKSSFVNYESGRAVERASRKRKRAQSRVLFAEASKIRGKWNTSQPLKVNVPKPLGQVAAGPLPLENVGSYGIHAPRGSVPQKQPTFDRHCIGMTCSCRSL